MLPPHTTVDGTSDGQEAFTQPRRQPPDAPVLDLDLPVMDGRELVRACRADARTRHVPIIAISAMDGGRAVRDLDVMGFLRKPFVRDTLRNALHEVPGYGTHRDVLPHLSL